MSLSPQTLKRLPKIKEGLLRGLNRQQIAELCGVKSEKTIDRDFKAWVNSGDFETWLKEEWVRLHNIILRESPLEAYRQVSKLVGMMVTRKIEKKEQIKISEQVVTLNVTENEDEILSKAAAILARKTKPRQIH